MLYKALSWVHISDKWIFTKINFNLCANFAVHSFNHMELLATNAPKNLGSRDLGYAPFQKFVTHCVWTVTGKVHVKNEVRSSSTTDRMRHNIRGVKLTPASRRRYKIGLPVEGLKQGWKKARFLFLRFFLDFSVQIRPDTKFRPRKHILWPFSLSHHFLQIITTHKSQLKYEIKYYLYKISPKNKKPKIT